jgi:hypothetical protein
MAKVRLIVAMLAAVMMTSWSPGGVLANHLLAPQNVGCLQSDANLDVTWNPVDAAQKYSVDVIVTYVGSTSGEEASQEFSFSTLSSPLTIEEFAGAFTADVDGDTTNDQVIRIDVKVKGLHPGNSQGRQNNPFSSPLVECSLSV